MRKSYFLSCTALISFLSCDLIDDHIGGGTDSGINNLEFIDEYVITDGEQFNGTTIGGLSSIDYSNGSYYMISDDANAPIRFYEADINFTDNAFSNVTFTNVTTLLDRSNTEFEAGTVDPEALRVKGNTVFWASEGNINNGVSPFVRKANLVGSFISEANTPNIFDVSSNDNVGPRQNGTFEGLTLKAHGSGSWVAMELPLKQDGPAPTISDTDSPIRVSHIDAHGNFDKQFAYELDPVARPAINGTSFELNGVVELLEYDTNQFLVLERSFATGYTDGGNTVKIYDVDARYASDVSAIESLQNTDYRSAKKTLLFDFEDIRSQLTNGVVDNIEGITFGPDFEDGSRSLLLVADNNFSAFGPQLNQLVLFKVK